MPHRAGRPRTAHFAAKSSLAGARSAYEMCGEGNLRSDAAYATADLTVAPRTFRQFWMTSNSPSGKHTHYLTSDLFTGTSGIVFLQHE